MKHLLLSLILGIFIQGALLSCKKDRGCYDEKLYLENKNTMCTMDCPGVTGCDGKKYCNECEASRQGIAIVK